MKTKAFKISSNTLFVYKKSKANRYDFPTNTTEPTTATVTITVSSVVFKYN